MSKKAPPNPPKRPRAAPTPNATGGERRSRAGDGAVPPRWRGQEVVIAERRAKALRLRAAGASYRSIAKELRIGVETAWTDVQAELLALREACTGAAEDLRELERQRLDRLLLSAMTIIESQGADDHAKVKAIAVAVRVADRRARLEGLDAPTKLEHSGQVTTDTGVTAVNLAEMTTEELVQYRDLMKAQETRAKAALAASVTA